MARAQAAAVAPVVMTSSTSNTRSPPRFRAWKAPATFERRPELLKPACGDVARIRRAARLNGIPHRAEISLASNSD
jgi:hypothetical protein